MINHKNLESELSKPLEEPLEITSSSKENLCWSGWTQTPQTLYLSQIIYGPTAISSKLLDALKHTNQSLDTRDIPSSLAWFISIHIPQSHIYIVQTFRILKGNVNNEGDDKLSTLKQAMHCSYWLKWKEAM